MNLTLSFPGAGARAYPGPPDRASRRHRAFPEMDGGPESPVRAIRHQPARPGEFADFPTPLPPALTQALTTRGIRQLYSHQAAAVEHAEAGRNVVVVTPTASGKTLCYNLPVLNRLIAEPGARAMYLFPTKALAEDQLQEFQAALWIADPAREHPRLHLRRRHASGRPAGHPRAGQRGADQSRHAARRYFAASHEMGQGVREFALRRDR